MILGIYGAGGLGREVMVLAQQINEHSERWKEIIFIDDFSGIPSLKGKSVLTFNEVIAKYNSESIEIVIANGEPHVRNMLRERVNNAGLPLAVLVHPSVSIPEGTTIGEGTIICYNSFISCDVTIGTNVLIQPCASIGHDSQVGNDTVISSYVCISGGCVIGEETYIGIHVSVREKIVIGSQTIVGMGSVVTRDIPDCVIALGNPARAMKENENHKVFRGKS
jgi:sugar O-acyltransferase (sialic acid O-acetyltransferase NeuD family)